MARRVLLPLLALLLAPAALPAQAGGGWDDARALELIARARERRAATQADSGLTDYRADARGRVYFYLDRPGPGGHTLVKTDQVALEVYWRAPAFSKQRIVGLRDRRSLPTNIRYHLDHLSVVQDNFGDRIRLGDGDEVSDVLHPAAPGGPAFYRYRLADSTTLRLPGSDEPVRVYEIEVRPRDPSRPGFVGTVSVERRRGDIVRMRFTFTPASYVDRQLDYINVSLENGLWEGRFWLPAVQRAEIRRQLPELGFPLGGVIRGVMRVSDYRFNQEISPTFFRGPRVVSVPEEQRERFPFEEPIDAELREEGLEAEADLDAIRSEAAGLMGARLLSGLPALRAAAPSASGVLRYDRAEGVVLAAGASRRVDERLTLSASAGWAFGASHPVLRGGATADAGRWRVAAEGHVNALRDVGVGPAASGLANSLAAVVAGRDYTEPFHASGAGLSAARAVGAGWTLEAEARAEAQRSAERESDWALLDDGFRPVRPIDRGTMLGGALALERAAPAERAFAWSARLAADGGVLDADSGGTFRFVRPTLALGAVRRWSAADAELSLEARGGVAAGELPRQALYLLGGRGTVPGFPFRGWGGDRFALARATASADLGTPWVRGRLLAAAGWTGVGDAGRDALAAWGAETTPRPRVSVGAGLGLVYDVLRVDLARGLGPEGRWELIVEARPEFWGFL